MNDCAMVWRSHDIAMCVRDEFIALSEMIPEEQKKVLDAWQTSARYWEKHRALITRMFAPLTSALVEEARITIGQDVLDIGGGSGEPSLTISSVVGPTGSVMYTDPVSGMVESAQAEASRQGRTNIHFKQCSADKLPFADCTFDVWGSKKANPFFSTITDVIDQFVEVSAEDPDAPDAFRFAAHGKLAGILEKAGAKDVIERQINFHIEAAISVEQFWQLRTEMSETLREEMARLTPAQLPTVKQAVADAAQRYFLSGAMSFPAEALIVSGRKRSILVDTTHGSAPQPHG